MPVKKKPTQEELFPHNGFPYRLEVIEDDGTKKGTKRISWFECEWHLTKHIERHRIVTGDIQVRKGEQPLSCDPFAVKPKRTRKTPSKAKKTTKPVAKAKSAKSTSKTTKKEVFSNLDTFFTT